LYEVYKLCNLIMVAVFLKRWSLKLSRINRMQQTVDDFPVQFTAAGLYRHQFLYWICQRYFTACISVALQWYNTCTRYLHVYVTVPVMLASVLFSSGTFQQALDVTKVLFKCYHVIIIITITIIIIITTIIIIIIIIIDSLHLLV